MVPLRHLMGAYLGEITFDGSYFFAGLERRQPRYLLVSYTFRRFMDSWRSLQLDAEEPSD